MSVRLSLECSAARAVGWLSRALGRGGGTTLPGKLLWKLDPGAIDALAAGIPSGVALVSATNGKTTTTAMAASILEPRHELAWNSAGANLASGVASTLLAAPAAKLALLEVDEAALPEILRRTKPRVVSLGNLFRDQLDRYGELEIVAERWRAAVAELPPTTVLVVNADDPVVADLAARREHVLRFGIDDPAHSRTSLPHAADSKYCVRCGRPYTYDAAYVGHLGAYRCDACGHRRPPLDVSARNVQLDGLGGSSFDLTLPSGAARVRLALPGLYNVYNAVAASSLGHSLGATVPEIVSGLESFTAAFGRFERIDAGGREVVTLLIKNPAGANEVIRTLVDAETPSVVVVALNDAIADGRDVSWIWDVDFEPLLERVERIVATGERAAELGLRFLYGGLPEDALDVVGSLGAALARGLELTPDGGRLVVLPTYTAMLALRAVAAERGLVRPYWERA
jgi:UDP-N-acetylmuramyl tripeptide synthase